MPDSAAPGDTGATIMPIRTKQAVRPNQTSSIWLMRSLLILTDALIVLGAGAIAYGAWLYVIMQGIATDYAFATVFATLLTVNIFYLAGLYDVRVIRRLGIAFRRLFAATGCVAALLVIVAYLTKTSADYSRVWSMLWLAIAFVGLTVPRIVTALKLRQWSSTGRYFHEVAILGGDETGQRLLQYFVEHEGAGVNAVRLFDDRSSGRLASEDSQKSFPHIAGNTNDLVQYAQHSHLDMIIVALPATAEERLAEIFQQLEVLPIDVRLFPGSAAFQLTDDSSDEFDGLPTLKVFERPLADWRFALKSLEDRVLGFLILTMIAPILAAIAVAIRLDSPGPALFRQKRYGYNNQLFEMFKFRTMYTDQSDPEGAQLTERNDPRITRLGGFLRRTSLDELPQFINVVRGEMSIVGPRPHAVSATADGVLYQDAVRRYAARHRVKPGITGWAQINGWRGETQKLFQIRNRVACDLYYIERWSVWLDLKIILLTIFKGFIGKHAF